MNQLKTDQQQQNEALKQQLSKIMDAMSKLQSQPAGTPAASAPSSGAANGPGAGTTGPVATGPASPAQWNVTDPNRGPAAGQGSQFYPGQGQGQGAGFYPGTGSGHLWGHDQ